MIYLKIQVMAHKTKVVLYLLLVVCFSLVPAIHYSEWECGNTPSLSKSGAPISNVRSFSSDFAPLKDTLKERVPQNALTLMAKRAVSNTLAQAKNSRVQQSLSSVITFDIPISSATRSFTRQIISHLRTEFCLFASDTSPPFYSLHQAQGHASLRQSSGERFLIFL